MNVKRKCVLIGYGYWGHIIERYLNKSEYFNLVCVCDPCILNGIPLETILIDNTIDIAFVCTPISTHYDIVKSLLKHKKHVFCEKPLTKSLKEARELVDIAADNNLCLYTDYIYTISPSINFLKEHIHEIGSILSIDGEIQQFGNFYKNDSVVEVLGVHLISATLYLLEEVEDIAVKGVMPIRCDKFNVLESRFELKSSQIPQMFFACSLVSEKKSRKLKITGEKGNLFFDMLGQYTAGQLLVEKENIGYRIIQERKITFNESNNLECAINRFYDEVRCKSKGNVKLAIAVANILEQLQQSIIETPPIDILDKSRT